MFVFCMELPPPQSTPPDTLFPYTSVFRPDGGGGAEGTSEARRLFHRAPGGRARRFRANSRKRRLFPTTRWQIRPRARRAGSPNFCDEGPRSEEQTSELQSLIRSSYAAYSLKKKKKQLKKINHINNKP